MAEAFDRAVVFLATIRPAEHLLSKQLKCRENIVICEAA